MIRLFIAVIGLSLASQVVQAGDGYVLLKECTAFANGDSVSQEKVAGVSMQLWSGCPASFSSALSSDVEFSWWRRVCLPDEVKNRQLAKMMVKYLNDHPEYLHRNEFELVREAFHEHFPCSIVDQLKHWKIIER